MHFVPVHRRASTYLEIQVAMVLLAIAMGGLYSLSVVQTKQNSRLADVMPANEIPAINASADQWERKLGVYASVDAAVIPSGPINPYVYFEAVADNQDGSPIVRLRKSGRDTYGWYSWNYWRSYRGNSHYHPSNGRTGSYCRFRIRGIPPGEYEVLTTYPHLNSLGAAIEHRIFDGGTLRASVKVNQRTAPADVAYDSQQWERLAVVSINSGTLQVQIRDGSGARSYVIADAILVRSARTFNLVSVGETPSGGAVAVLETP